MSSSIKSDLILLLAAIIWGFAFVAQRVGMNYVEPFTFTGVRFALGAIILIPFLLRSRKNRDVKPLILSWKSGLLPGCIITGLLLFAGVSLQQFGLLTTTAGKAGFLTELYVVFVPVVGLFFKHKTGIYVWAGVILSVAGLYFLCITTGFYLSHGDLLVLMCAFVFSGHVLMISWLSPRMDPYLLSVFQFLVCAILSLILAFTTETVNFNHIIDAALPIAYGGILSVGIAYTLQVIAQQKAHPAHASVILSLEAVFAAIGGWMLLNEQFSNRSLLGCLLMLAGAIVVQIKRS